MGELKHAVMKTLVYADLFDQALTTEELQRYLIGYQSALEQLNKLQPRFNLPRRQAGRGQAPRFNLQNGFWCLSGREVLSELRSQQLQTTNYKLQTAKRYGWLFRLVPWVRLVAITGSVAGGSPKVHDDIDLLIIASSKRMWLSRLWLTSILSLLGKRRKPNDDPQNVPDKFCLNMWLTEDRLENEHQDVYVANELARMAPILNRDGMYGQYLAANSWIEKVLPNFFYSVQRPRSSVQTKGFRLFDWLDSKAEQWQRKRMRRVTKETVEDDLLMFHPIDYRQQILQQYERRLKDLGLKT